VRHILAEKKLDLSKQYGDLDKALGEKLLTPTEIYTLDCLALIKLLGENLRTFSHVTGGGLADNTARVIPDTLSAHFDRSTWSLPPELLFLASEGSVPQSDYERTWNCGVGMIAIVGPDSADLTIKALAARGMQAWVAGSVSATTPGAARSALEGGYRKR
jgi:phosphoribosylformylglycinamidine cyclo-ligase